MTATLTEMGELLDIQRDDLGRQMRVNVNVSVKACHASPSHGNVQES